MSLEYKLVTFMTVLLVCLYDVHVRHFSDPLLSQCMQIEAWRCAGMGACRLSVHLGHVWERCLTSRALHTVITHCAQTVLAMMTVVSELGKMLLASCTILSRRNCAVTSSGVSNMKMWPDN